MIKHLKRKRGLVIFCIFANNCTQVDFIKEFLRAKQEAEEAEAKKIKEEEERLEALQKAREEAALAEQKKREEKKKREKELKEQKKADGTYMTAKEKEKARLNAIKLAAMGSRNYSFNPF